MLVATGSGTDSITVSTPGTRVIISPVNETHCQTHTPDVSAIPGSDDDSAASICAQFC